MTFIIPTREKQKTKWILPPRIFRAEKDFIASTTPAEDRRESRRQEGINIMNEMIQSGQARTSTPIIIPPREKPSFLSRVGEYFMPKPKVRAIDVVREIPGALATVGNFIRTVQQEIARSGASVALTITGAPGGGAKELDISGDNIENKVARVIFGDRPLQSIETRIANAELAVKDWGQKLEKSDKEWKKSVGKFSVENALGLSVIGVGGTIALDFTGAGGQKSAVKALAQSKDVGFISKLLRQIGVAEDIIPATASKISTIKDEKIILNALNKIDDIQKSTKIIKEGIEKASQIKLPTKAVFPPVQEVTKLRPQDFATAEEYVENFVARDKGGAKITSPYGDTVPLNKDGTITLYHRTTPEIAEKIKKEGLKGTNMQGEEGRVYFTTNPERGAGRAIGKEKTAVLKFEIDPRKTNIDEVYRDGTIDLWAMADEIKGVSPKEKVQSALTKSQLTDIWNKANKGEVKQTLDDIFEVKPKVSIQDMVSKTLPPQKQGQLAKTISRSMKPYKPIITQRAQESTFLKRKLKAQEVSAKKGAVVGQKVGIAKAENIAEISKEKAVRGEQLKALKGGIKIRAQKDAIIKVLKNTTESSEQVKKMIVEHVKDALDPKDRGKAITLIRDAKTHKNLAKAFSRINKWAEDSIKRNLKNEVLNIQKKIMDSPSIAIDYKARVKELMGDFELKGHRESTLERLKKTQEFLQNEIAKGNDVEIPRRVLKSLELLNRTPFEEITINQITGLKAEMELLENLGRTKLRTIENIWDMQKGKIIEEITTQGAEPITKIQLIKPEIGERLTFTQKFKNLIWSAGNEAARIDKAIAPMDTIFDLLDGGKGTYDGANFRFFKGQIDAGYGRYITRKDALQESVIDLANKYKLDDINFEKMGVVAAREQDGGIEKLIASGFTKEQVDAVKLTTQEQEVLDLMRSTFDSQFPEIKDVMRRVYNQPVEKAKNYFSFMTDWKAMDESEVFQRFGSQLPEQYGAPRKNVEVGFTKTRVGGEQKIKINALDIFLQHTDNTSYLLEIGETSKMLGEVAASPKYAELIGDVGQLMVREWLDVIARKGGASGASEIAILNTLRKNVGIGILGMKLSTIAIQPTALIDGMGLIGVKYGRKGITNFTTSAEWRKFIGNMPEIKDRMGGEFALRELTDDNWLQSIQRKGFIPMQKLDQMTAGAIAAGAYERKMVELGRVINLTKPYDKEALAYAQLAVRRTQSSGAFKDVPLAVSRGALTGNRSLDRAILQFQNFSLARWSRIRHDAIRAGINTKDPKKAIPILTAIIIASATASGIRLGVNKIQDFITDREDEDTIQEDLTKGFMYEMTGNVPFLGTAVSMAMYDGEMFPLLDAPKGVISGLNRVITSKSEGAKLRGFTEFAGSTGALLGIPGSAQTEQLIRGALQEKPKTSRQKELDKIFNRGTDKRKSLEQIFK